MADYPVLDGAGNVIVANAVDPLWVPPLPIDLNTQYPVLDGEGNVIVQQPYDAWFDPVRALTPGAAVLAVWDASDLDTMYQDRAGSIPVTAPGQLVGVHRDKGASGLHKVAINDAARGTLRREPVTGVRNLLTRTEQFDNAAWGRVSIDVAANSATAPNGELTADTWVPTADNGGHYLSQNLALTGEVTQSVYAKADGYNFVGLTFNNSTTLAVFFNLQTLAVTSIGAGVTAHSIEDVGNGWRRLSLTVNTTVNFIRNYVALAASFGAFSGDGTSGIHFWGAQVEVGSTATPYQRVTNANDITEAGVRSTWWIKTDAINTGYVTPNVNPGVGQMQVWAGVRKLSNATSIIMEHSVNFNSNAGSFMLLNISTGSRYEINARSTGTSTGGYSGYRSSDYIAPHSAVLTGAFDFAGTERDAVSLAVQVNGVSDKFITAGDFTANAVNFGNYPLYFYRRAGTSLPLNGQSSIEIMRFGDNLSPELIAQTNEYAAYKTGVTV